MVEFTIEHVFKPQHMVYALVYSVLIVKEVAYLKAYLRVLIRVEGGYAGLRGAVGLVGKPGLLKAVQLLVIGHQHLAAL